MRKLIIEMPDGADAANIVIVIKNGLGGSTFFTHAFNPNSNLKIDWEDERKARLVAVEEMDEASDEET